MEIRTIAFLLFSLLSVRMGQGWQTTTAPLENPPVIPDYVSCRHKCGGYALTCSCTSVCGQYNECCRDYNMYCRAPTDAPTSPPDTTNPEIPQCGGNLYGSGSFYSPYYPNDYHNNAFCVWYISVLSGLQVVLKITDIQLEKCFSCDYIEVYDGPSLSSRPLGKVYFNDTMTAFYSSSEHLTVLFRSDGSVVSRGFRADFTSSLPDSAEPTVSPGSCRNKCGDHSGWCSCTTTCGHYKTCCPDYGMYCGALIVTQPDTTYTANHLHCGGNLYSSGSFYSPYYPNNYHDNAYCLWYISAPSGQQVVLTITEIQLENCCPCDYIEVYDGPSLSSRPLGKVCFNETMADFHSSSEHLTVLFRSDGSVVSRGFRADFTSSLPDSAGRVECSSDNMNIVIQTSYLNSMGYSGNDLYLNDQSCRPSVSYSQVVFNFALDTCGTRREFNKGRIVYTNGVRAYYRSQSSEITRQSQFTLQFLCKMEQDATAQIMYVSHESEAGNITGSGTFNVTMAFYTSGSFNYPVYESPYVVSLNQYLYVQVRPRTTDGSLVLFLDTCVASPSPHDFTTRSYDLVRNGCRRDSSYFTYSSGSREVAQFRFLAFAFMRSHPDVYLQCKVAICRANDNSSRCAQGCRTRKARSLRSAANGETATFILGPIQLGDPKKPEEGFPVESVAQMDV